MSRVGYVLVGLALLSPACSSSSVMTGETVDGGAGGTAGSGGATGRGGTTGAGGATGAGGRGGAGGTTGAGGGRGGSGGGGVGGAGGTGGPTGPTFDSCTCTCTCTGGAGTLTNAPCRTSDGTLCTCDNACASGCVNGGLGSAVSGTGTCAHTNVPQVWSCSLTSYQGGDGCTCGCGARDPDCASAAASACGSTCNAQGSCATSCSQIATANNGTCGDVPATWKCSPAFYGRGDGCDCGCGALDLDCLNSTRGACDFCINPGSCAKNGCVDVLAERNELCAQPTPPAGWTCSPLYWDARDGCNCGCGVVDPDCLDATRTSCEHCADLGSCNFFQCENINVTNNAVCN